MKLEEMKEELVSFESMLEFMDRVISRSNGLGNDLVKAKNTRAALIAAAKIVTAETADEESEAIEELNNIMR